jgi:hypothetical protein
MKILVPVMLLFFMYQVYAGDLIILDKYYLEKIERESSDKVHEIKQVDDARGPVTQTEVNDRNVDDRNVDDYRIRRHKNHRVYDKDEDDSPLLRFQF